MKNKIELLEYLQDVQQRIALYELNILSLSHRSFDLAKDMMPDFRMGISHDIECYKRAKQRLQKIYNRGVAKLQEMAG